MKVMAHVGRRSEDEKETVATCLSPSRGFLSNMKTLERFAKASCLFTQQILLILCFR